jgi:hypothetical protein
MVTPVPEPHAIFPLTLFDDMCANPGIVLGWLVEGELDLNLISAALDRLVNKWPLLAGRLERVPSNVKSNSVCTDRKKRYVSLTFPFPPHVESNIPNQGPTLRHPERIPGLHPHFKRLHNTHLPLYPTSTTSHLLPAPQIALPSQLHTNLLRYMGVATVPTHLLARNLLSAKR